MKLQIDTNILQSLKILQNIPWMSDVSRMITMPGFVKTTDCLYIGVEKVLLNVISY